MRKILILFFMLSLVSCQVSFDPAGKLARPLSTPTGTSTAAPIESVIPSASATLVSCRATGDLNLRLAPSATAEIVDYFYQGDVITPIGPEQGGWRAVVNWAGTPGYVNTKWLECGG
jgi:hypothetical protein